VVLPLLATTRGLLWLSGVRPPAADDAAEVQKQVLAAVADSVAAAELPPAERTWIGNIVALKDLEVAAVMRPRPDIVAFQADLPLQQALQQAMEHGYSRYPVYEQRIDEIAGIFHVKDALRLLQSDDPKFRQTPLRELLHEPLFVPETMGLAVLLRRFQKDQLHLAIVLDEYGTTAGLVSLEDVLEQIVGDLGDEYDTPEETTAAADRVEVLETGRVIEVSGRTPVSVVNEHLHSELPEDGDFETIAGLVIAECNRIPAVDETVAVGQTEFRVLAADDRRIHRLRVSLLQPEASEGAR
jgi:CBS domain containing-hemolysin-like protein